MCPVQWGASPRACHPVLPFANPKPYATVLLLSGPELHVTIKLHWHEEDRGSFPCLGDECRMCPRPSHVATYTSGFMHCVHTKRWTRCIVPLGDPRGRLAQEDFTRMAIVISREDKNDPRSSIILKGKHPDDLVMHKPEYAPFDVKPFLLRRWGLFNADQLLGCELHFPLIEAQGEPSPTLNESFKEKHR